MATLPALLVDRTSPVPLYYQVAQQLESAIDSGVLKPGTRLENEIQIAANLGLSRPTVRRAIQYLVEAGLLVRKRGIGTQVVGGRVKRQVELSSLFDDLVRDGRAPSTTVLSYEVAEAEAHVCFALDIPEGTHALDVVRLRFARAEPIALMHNYLPTRFAEHVTPERLERQGLYQLLRSAGVHLRIASQRVGARKAMPVEARHLRVARGSPLLTMERTTYDDKGQPVEHAEHVYRGDTYSLEMTLASR